MIWGTVNNFKCSTIIFFFSISICVSAVSFFIASLCPPIYGAAFDRMFTSRCLCTIIRHGRINLSLYRIDVLCHPFRYFVLLNCNCSLEALNISTCIGKVINSILQVSFYLQRGSNIFLAMNCTLLISYTWRAT